MFSKQRQGLIDPVEKAADRQELAEVKDRLLVVEKRVRILTYQLQIMRRETPTTGGMA